MSWRTPSTTRRRRSSATSAIASATGDGPLSHTASTRPKACQARASVPPSARSDGNRVHERLVVRQRDELRGGVDRVVRAAGLGAHAAEHDEVVDLGGQPEHERRERALGGQDVAVAVVDGVLVGREPHAREPPRHAGDGLRRDAVAAHPGEQPEAVGEVHRRVDERERGGVGGRAPSRAAATAVAASAAA